MRRNILPLARGDHNAPDPRGWYTPGRSDGFGDRLLTFDQVRLGMLERLRFHGAIAKTPGFETALQDRVTALAGFQHPAFPPIRGLEREANGSLTLVSTHLAGKRLAELFTPSAPLHPGFVSWLIREATGALAALQGQPDIAHGAITEDRIVLTAEGRVLIVEHVLGAAVDRLQATPSRLWREFGIVAPAAGDGETARLDAASDVVQLAMASLSSLVGRRLTLDDYRDRLPAILDELASSDRNRDLDSVPLLRRWLERALQTADSPFRTAAAALEGAAELSTVSPEEALAFIAAAHAGGPPARHDQNRLPAVKLPGAAASVAAPDLLAPAGASDPVPSRRFRFGWLAGGLALLALTQTIVIVRLLVTRSDSPAAPVETRAAAQPPDPPLPDREALPPTLPAPQEPAATAVPGLSQPALHAPPDPEVAAALASAAARPRPGGVRIVSPIELNVLEGNRVLGSTADGPIVAPAGVHRISLINTALGYESQQTVTFTAGQVIALTITPPAGRLSINAQPWADVSVDGVPVGQTPLANLPVALGNHEVAFRHPQYGEKRETVIVRADRVTRVSAGLGPQ